MVVGTSGTKRDRWGSESAEIINTPKLYIVIWENSDNKVFVKMNHALSEAVFRNCISFMVGEIWLKKYRRARR